jgi:hypothetical protein
MTPKEKDNSGMPIGFVILIAVLIYYIYVMIS